MPRKPPPNPIKKGEVRNPGGRPKLPDDIKEARKVGQVELERAINRLIYLPLEQLRVVIKDPKTPMLDIMLATIMAQCAQKGDQARLDFILNRSAVGKVQDRIVVKQSEPFIIQRGNGQQVVLGFSGGADDGAGSDDSK